MKRTDTGFHDFIVQDLLADVPGIHSRRMFGGYGIYAGEKFFALIAEGWLYLKASPELALEFKKHGSKPFVYEKPKQKKRVTLSSYWSVPEDILENREEFLRWVRQSIRFIKER